MKQRTSFLIMMAFVILVGGIGGYLFRDTVTASPPQMHQNIVDQITMTVDISSTMMNQPAHAKCIRAEYRPIKSLDLIDVARKSRYYGAYADLSEWVWEYQNYPVAYMKLWGPYSNSSEVLLEFSKCTMTSMKLAVGDTVHSFTLSSAVGTNPGYLYEWLEINS